MSLTKHGYGLWFTLCKKDFLNVWNIVYKDYVLYMFYLIQVISNSPTEWVIRHQGIWGKDIYLQEQS